MNNPKIYVTLNELSDILGLPPSWIRREAKEDRLPYLMAGRSMMFHVEAVQTLLQDRQVKEMKERLGEE